MSQGSNSSHRKRVRTKKKGNEFARSIDTKYAAELKPSYKTTIDKLEENLGKQGKPVGLDESLKKTNPNWERDNEKWDMNCQRCVYANEAIRRGYDVTAKPYVPGGDRMENYGTQFSEYGGWRRAFEDQEWSGVGGLGSRTATVEANIYKQMAEWGDGARAVIKVVWKGRNSGHVFNIEQVSGKSVAYDAQTGRRINDLNEYFSIAMPTKTEISRIDNLTTPTPWFFNTVQPSKERRLKQLKK